MEARWFAGERVIANQFTTELQLIKPTPGDPLSENTWGTLLNTDMDLLDSAVAGLLTLSVAGSSNVVLSSSQGAADQERNMAFSFTGALTGNIYVLFPSGRTKTFFVANNTTGSFTLGIGVNNGSSVPAGTTVTVTQGTSVALISDGTNVTTGVSASASLGGDLSGALSSAAVVSTHLLNPMPLSQGGIGAGSLSSAGIAALAVAQAFTKGQRGTPVALTDGVSTAIDLSLANNFTWGIGANGNLLANPSNMFSGQSGVIAVTPTSGAFTPSFASQYVAVGGVGSLSFSATLGVTDYLPYYSIDTTHCLLMPPIKNPSH